MDLSPQDAFILRRAMARMPIDAKQLSPALNLMMRAYNLDNPDGYQQFSSVITSDTDLLVQIMKVDPNTPPAQPTTQSAAIDPIVYVPPLPREAQLTSEAIRAMDDVGDWYKLTSAWAAQRSPMTPPHFLQAATIWLAGLACARRLVLHLHDRIYPHLYLLIVAETSRYAKSTGMSVFYSLIHNCFPHLLVPGSATTEAMMEILSGQSPANYEKLPQTQQRNIDAGRKFAGQRGIMLDEYSSLLGSSKKDYMQGFIELLMRLYDAREVEQYYTRSGGLLTINRPGISIFGATTPAAMARSLNNETWENGEMARYLIFFREEVLGYNDDYARLEIPPDVIAPLVKLHTALPNMKEFDEDGSYHPMSASFEPRAFDAYRAYAQAVRYTLIEDCDPRLHGNYTRMHVQAIKIALALAATDYLGSGKDYVQIELGHWALAQQMVERSRANLHSLMLSLNETKDSRIQRDLLVILRQNPGGLTVRDFCRRMSAYADEIRSGLDVLLESGDIMEIEHKPTTGRPTKVYSVKASETAPR
jgi:hypothetical protein